MLHSVIERLRSGCFWKGVGGGQVGSVVGGKEGAAAAVAATAASSVAVACCLVIKSSPAPAWPELLWQQYVSQ